MRITTRISASGFIEITVNEIETTIFKSEVQEVEFMIENLQDAIEDLKKLIQ